MVSLLCRKSAPTRIAWAPRWCEMLSTTWNIAFLRSWGLTDSVPNVATPAMLTAGPIGSVDGALRSLYVNCARVSLTVRGDSVQVLLTAAAWSTLSSPADADGALRPPAPRAFSDVMSYRLHRSES